jgi:hypothetical protein
MNTPPLIKYHTLIEYEQIFAKYDKIMTKDDPTNQIHVENFQERHCLRINKQKRREHRGGVRR